MPYGQGSFPNSGNLTQDLARRQTEPPPSLRKVRPDLPAELDVVLSKLLAVNPEDRYPNPRQAMRALLPFLKEEQAEYGLMHEEALSPTAGTARLADSDRR